MSVPEQSSIVPFSGCAISSRTTASPRASAAVPWTTSDVADPTPADEAQPEKTKNTKKTIARMRPMWHDVRKLHVGFRLPSCPGARALLRAPDMLNEHPS